MTEQAREAFDTYGSRARCVISVLNAGVPMEGRKHSERLLSPSGSGSGRICACARGHRDRQTGREPRGTGDR